MLSIPDGELFHFKVTPNSDPQMTLPAFVAEVGNLKLWVWSDGRVRVGKEKFSGLVLTETTLEKIWDEELTESEIKAALAEQEEYIRRQLSCSGIVGKSHLFRRHGRAATGTAWSECFTCGVTETTEDYRKKNNTQE